MLSFLSLNLRPILGSTSNEGDEKINKTYIFFHQTAQWLVKKKKKKKKNEVGSPDKYKYNVNFLKMI